MLRFARMSKTFVKVLDSCMCIERDMIIDNDEEDFRLEHQFTSQYLTKEETIKLLDKLIEANKDEKNLYQLTDYHFALIYECITNENFIDDGDKQKSLDIGYICYEYFWDMDFQIDEEGFVSIPGEVKRSMGISDETFGVVMKLKPSPEEIELKACSFDNYEIEEKDDELFDEVFK